MITRIRYYKQEDGSQLSPAYQAGDKAVQVKMVNNTYTVINAVTGEFITGGQVETPHKLRKVVKKTLKDMGVLFADEIRKKVGVV